MNTFCEMRFEAGFWLVVMRLAREKYLAEGVGFGVRGSGLVLGFRAEG